MHWFLITCFAVASETFCTVAPMASESECKFVSQQVYNMPRINMDGVHQKHRCVAHKDQVRETKHG